MRRVLFVGLMGQFLVVSGCYGTAVCLRGALTDYKNNVEMHVVFAPGSKLVVKNEAGAIRVGSDEGTDCRITAKVYVHAPHKQEARELGEQVQIAAEPNHAEPNHAVVRVTVKKPPMPQEHRFVSVDLDILVPRQAHVDCDTELQLARAATRQKEIAIRQALGAGRRRVLRQLLVENLLLALAGGICGVLLAVWLDRVVCMVLATIASVRLDPQLHPRVLLFALAISLATGVAFGLAPALQLVGRSIVPYLKESAPGANVPARRWNSHNLLVVGPIAVALVVMVPSGLCLRSLIGLHRINQGYDPACILVGRLDMEGWLHDRPDLRRFMEDLQERVKRLPGVMSTSLAALAPLDGRGYMQGVAQIEGVEMPSTELGSWNQGIVGPGHFQTLGQSVLAGRDFTLHDGPEATKVMIVNEVLAQRYWPNQDPIGKRVWFREETGACEIVGLVKSAKVRNLLEEPRPVAYLPLAQNQHKPTPVLRVRTAGRSQPLVPVLRKEAAVGAPAGMEIFTIAERISVLLLPQRILTEILNVFGLVGLLLSATGIYAVVAYAVRQRTREIGIRIALGARGQDVLLPVLLRGALLLTMGLGLGLGLSLAGTRVLASRLPQIRAWNEYFLYGIYTWDPATYAGATLLIAVVALLACYVPARRAARTDPMAALRYE